MLLKPSSAITSRRSLAKNLKKLTTWSGFPVNNFRSSLSCVATPTGHVFKWHLRIIIQPPTTNAAVATPHSSAPSIVAMAMSRPVRICPSVCSTTRLRKLFFTSVWWASDKPSSHGRPAWRTELIGDAPVPPSAPEIKIASAFAFATPAATVPTPACETSFTLIRAWRLAFFKS